MTEHQTLIERTQYPPNPDVALLREAIYRTYGPRTDEYERAHEALSDLIEISVRASLTPSR